MNNKLYEKLNKAKDGDLISVNDEELEELNRIQRDFLKNYQDDYKYCPHCGKKLKDREQWNPYPQPVWIDPYYTDTGDTPFWTNWYTIC